MKDPNEETKESYHFKVFEREVLKQAETLVKLNAQKTVGMVEAVFGQKHLDMINRLESDELQFVYISKLVESKEDDIMNKMNGYSQNNKNSYEATMWS